jgi:hypothetical protein
MSGDLDAEHARLLAEHQELEAQHHELEKRPNDMVAHRAHSQRLREHITQLHAYMAKRGFRRQC